MFSVLKMGLQLVLSSPLSTGWLIGDLSRNSDTGSLPGPQMPSGPIVTARTPHFLPGSSCLCPSCLCPSLLPDQKPLAGRTAVLLVFDSDRHLMFVEQAIAQ